MSRIYKIGLLATCILVFIVAGCKKNDSVPVNADPNKNQTEIANIKSQTSIPLSSDAVVVSSDDGGGRDSSYGFYSWIVFSPSPIIMPPAKEAYGKDYLNLPLEPTLRFFERRINKKISNPQIALNSYWDNDKYSCRGTLVRSPKGDYLYIERFIRKTNTLNKFSDGNDTAK